MEQKQLSQNGDQHTTTPSNSAGVKIGVYIFDNSYMDGESSSYNDAKNYKEKVCKLWAQTTQPKRIRFDSDSSKNQRSQFNNHQRSQSMEDSPRVELLNRTMIPRNTALIHMVHMDTIMEVDSPKQNMSPNPNMVSHLNGPRTSILKKTQQISKQDDYLFRTPAIPFGESTTELVDLNTGHDRLNKNNPVDVGVHNAILKHPTCSGTDRTTFNFNKNKDIANKGVLPRKLFNEVEFNNGQHIKIQESLDNEIVNASNHVAGHRNFNETFTINSDSTVKQIDQSKPTVRDISRPYTNRILRRDRAGLRVCKPTLIPKELLPKLLMKKYLSSDGTTSLMGRKLSEINYNERALYINPLRSSLTTEQFFSNSDLWSPTLNSSGAITTDEQHTSLIDSKQQSRHLERANPGSRSCLIPPNHYTA